MSVDLKSDGFSWEEVDPFSLDSVSVCFVFPHIPRILLGPMTSVCFSCVLFFFLTFYFLFFCQGLWSGATRDKGYHTIATIT